MSSDGLMLQREREVLSAINALFALLRSLGVPEDVMQPLIVWYASEEMKLAHRSKRVRVE